MTAGSDDEFEDMLCVERESDEEDEDTSNDSNTEDSVADNPQLQTQPPQTPTQTSTPSAFPLSSPTSDGRPTMARVQYPETHYLQRGRPTTAGMQHSTLSPQRGRPTTAGVQHSTLSPQRGRPTTAGVHHSTLSRQRGRPTTAGVQHSTLSRQRGRPTTAGVQHSTLSRQRGRPTTAGVQHSTLSRQHGRPTTAGVQHSTLSRQRGRPTTAGVQHSTLSPQRGRPTTAGVQHSTLSRQRGRPTTAGVQHSTLSPQRGRPTTAGVQHSTLSPQRGRPTTARVQHSTTPTLSATPATPPTQPDRSIQQASTTGPGQRARADQGDCSTTWSSTLTPVDVAPFTQPVGPTVPIPSSPVEVFTLFFTDDIMTFVVEQSNLYAKQVLGEERYAEWEKISVPELRAYFGFMILMGLYPKPAVRDYWKRDPFVNYPPISERISRDRFYDIGRYLHFADNTTLVPRGQPGHDRLGKVRPVMEKVSERFLSLYNPHCENSMDEAMLRFEGRSSLKQYMPAKPVKRGIKVWCRADAHNGYLCEYEVYTGRSEGVQDGLGKRVVLGLSQKLEGLRYHLYFDNFFSSVSLLSTLLDKGLYACGTARQSYKDFPASLKMRGKSKREMEEHGLNNR